MIFSFQPS